MRVGLIDVDSHNFPNLALMKISAWHKARGDAVEWWFSDLYHYDIVYMSKVFSDSYSPDVPAPLNADKVVKGGTGYAIKMENGREVYHPELDPPLPYEVEHITPDYSLYGQADDIKKATAYGFMTRGCPRGCGFCHVAGKEGRMSRKVADLSEFWTGQGNIEIMDPNILAYPGHLELLEQLAASRAIVNYSQGLDIRLMSREAAEIIGATRVKRLHFAWDNPADDLPPYFERFTGWYRRKNRATKVVYVLTNYGSTHEEDLYRIYTLRDLGYDPYVMIYDKEHAPALVKQVQRWVNNKRIFRKCDRFEDYVANMARKGNKADEPTQDPHRLGISYMEPGDGLPAWL